MIVGLEQIIKRNIFKLTCLLQVTTSPAFVQRKQSMNNVIFLQISKHSREISELLHNVQQALVKQERLLRNKYNGLYFLKMPLFNLPLTFVVQYGHFENTGATQVCKNKKTPLQMSVVTFH